MSFQNLLSVKPIINAAGPVTRLSGSLMHDEVVEAMAEAARACYDIAELQAAAGKMIAEATGAEAGYVTSGASAGLLLGVAATQPFHQGGHPSFPLSSNLQALL